jgi:hypothetical protein
VFQLSQQTLNRLAFNSIAAYAAFSACIARDEMTLHRTGKCRPNECRTQDAARLAPDLRCATETIPASPVLTGGQPALAVSAYVNSIEKSYYRGDSGHSYIGRPD